MSPQQFQTWDRFEYTSVFENHISEFVPNDRCDQIISVLLENLVPRPIPAPDWIRGCVVQAGSYERHKMAPELHEWSEAVAALRFRMNPISFLRQAVPEYVILTIVEWYLKLLAGGASQGDALSIMVENAKDVRFKQNPRCKNLNLSKINGPFSYIDCFDRAMIPRVDPRREFELETAVSILISSTLLVKLSVSGFRHRSKAANAMVRRTK